MISNNDIKEAAGAVTYERGASYMKMDMCWIWMRNAWMEKIL